MDIVDQLNNASNWLKQPFGNWKDVPNQYDDTPFDAAKEILRLRAELEGVKESSENWMEGFKSKEQDLKIADSENESLRAELSAANDKLQALEKQEPIAYYSDKPHNNFTATPEQREAWPQSFKDEYCNPLYPHPPATNDVSRLLEALKRASYALFQIKRMTPESIREFADSESVAASEVIDEFPAIDQAIAEGK